MTSIEQDSQVKYVRLMVSATDLVSANLLKLYIVTEQPKPRDIHRK